MKKSMEHFTQFRRRCEFLPAWIGLAAVLYLIPIGNPTYRFDVLPNAGLGSALNTAPLGAQISKASHRLLGSAQPTLLPAPANPRLNLRNAGHLSNPSPIRGQWNPEQQQQLNVLRWQSAKHLQAIARPENGTVRFLKGWRLEEAAETPASGLTLPETTAFNFLDKNGALFRIDDSSSEWTLTSSHQDALGLTHVRFEQNYEGLEVWPSSATIQISQEGHANQVHAAYAVTPQEVNTVPTLELADAQRRAISHLQTAQLAFSDQPEIEDQELLVYAPIDSDPHLAYSFHIHETAGVAWQVFVEAHNGEILTAFDHICTAAVEGSGLDTQGNQQALSLWQEGAEFAMVNTTKSMFNSQRSTPPAMGTTFGGILVFDAQNISPIDNPNAFNPQLVTSTSATAGFGPNAVSAAVNLSRVYDYFESRHQRLSINGQGGNIVSVINVPINNAYWQNDIVTFGNEDSWAHALDFAGHEMTHGIIEKSAGLIYQDQPGALNEAFADIFGESVEAFFANGSPDWRLGSLLSKPLRDMKEPGSLQIGLGRAYPSRMSEFIPPADPFLDNFEGRDNGGVHLNSSVINHAFYQLAEGLPAAIGLISAERIFYRALTTKLQKQSQFLDCRIACVQSAEELFGAGSTESQQTAAAFNAVEIFEQAPVVESTPLPTVTGEDSTLFTFVSPVDGFTYLARQEAALSDDPGGILLVATPVAPNKRPVVSRDGSVALFVTADYALGLVDTQTAEVEILGEANSVWSVGLSPDATHLGFVLAENEQPENVIRVVNIETEQTEEFTLKAPALDGGATDTILFADVLNFTPNNEVIYYDALNRIRFSDGSQLDSWSIFTVNRSTGVTVSVVPPLPGLNIGNPSLGRVNPNHMVFEAGNLSTGISHIFTQDLTTGSQTEVGAVIATVGLSFPDFFGDDSAILYSDYAFDAFGLLTAAGLSRQPLADDGLTANGDPSVWLLGSAAGVNIGTIYRRGEFAGINTIEVSASNETISESSANPASFVLTRTGPSEDPLVVPFLLTGTATPKSDYTTIDQVAMFEAGATEARVSIPLINDTDPEGPETLVITLTQAATFSLGEKSSATITIQDDDPEISSGYERWANENQVTSPETDPDNDGRPNLLEYALGTQPNAADEGGFLRSRLTLVNGATFLVIDVDRKTKRGDIIYGLQQTQDFATWGPATADFELVEDSETKISWRTTQSIQSTTAGYFRLSITLNETVPQ